MKILFLSDIVGRPGREAVSKILPTLKDKFSPDIVIANGENLAHGKGVTLSVIQEMQARGIDFFTSGNHVWKKEGKQLLQNKSIPLIRPANYPSGVIGRGYETINVRTRQIVVVNLIGRTFFRHHYECPFRTADSILATIPKSSRTDIFVDFHVEASSEAKALGYYLDGRVSAVVGTHTHVQTSDDQILPEGSAFITSAGMCGVRHSVLGKNKEAVIEGFLKQDSVDADWDSTWTEAIVEGVFVETTSGIASSSIERISEIVRNA